MNPVRSALYTRLTGDTTLTGLLSATDAVFHQRAPQDAQTPYVIFQKTSGNPRYTFADHLQYETWMVKGVARGLGGRAEDIAARLDIVLTDAPIAPAGHDVLYLRRETDIDYPEDDGAETFRHVGATYRLITEPA